MATALTYLHEEWQQCVLHTDIKSSNLMLDADVNAHLGDFGLARSMDHEKDGEDHDDGWHSWVHGTRDALAKR